MPKSAIPATAKCLMCEEAAEFVFNLDSVRFFICNRCSRRGTTFAEPLVRLRLNYLKSLRVISNGDNVCRY